MPRGLGFRDVGGRLRVLCGATLVIGVPFPV